MARENSYDERYISQIPAIEVLQKLGYQYLSSEEAERVRGNLYNVLLRDVLEEKLRLFNFYEYKGKVYKFSDSNIQQAIRDLDEPLTNGVIKTNESIYETLMKGRTYSEFLPDGSKKSFTIQFIDWNNIKNNVFHVVEEFDVERMDGRGTVRPDIVLFINGIPFVVIECKKASISMEQGISQMIRNQGKDYAPQLFKFIQIVMSTNKNETKYATCNTPKKFWSVWKEEKKEWLESWLDKAIEGRLPTMQDKNIVSLFHPERLLEFMKFFILFDKDVKKVARYQQYFAIKEIIKTIQEKDENRNRQSGVIWHTQGSGKSLTMVMLTKYILSEFFEYNPKVVVVTDRIELDKQIHKTFRHTRLKAMRATTGSHLVELINDSNTDIVTSLVHKFDTASTKQTSVESRDIFILVDESHRTQYGELHIKMKKVFPNACYLGFTGTPLMKKEKSTMIKFGKLIHTYTIADGVRDKAIVPLLYEGKMVDQSVNQRAIDNRLKMITRNLNEKQKEEVKKKWSQFERIASSNQRISMIAFDINEHFFKNYKTQGSNFKAMLATNSKIEAIRYLESFDELNDLNCAVIISPPDQREGHEVVDGESKDKIQCFWKRMMERYGTPEEYEDAIKDEFINGDEIDLLIVVDKLLTGFDAPRATVFYVDKPMKEHTLLQAIARVNRLYEGKDYGFIVDYRGLLDKLDQAMQMYSGAGLENFDPKDLEGAIYDVISVIGSLRQYHSDLLQIFTFIKNKQDVEEYEVWLEDEERREGFYGVLSNFGKNLGITLESEKVYNALPPEELQKYKKDLKFFQELRKSVKLRYSDTIDHKEYEAKMQKLMDNYISAEEIIRITNPVDILNEKAFEEELERLDSKRAKADAIRTRLTKSVSAKWDENPAFYKKFSERIQEAIQEYKDKRISEAEYLNKMKNIMKDYRKGESTDDYPEVIKENRNAQAFYGVTKDIISEVTETSSSYGVDPLGDLAIKMDQVIKEHQKVDWHNNIEIHNRIAQDLDDLLFDFADGHNLEMDYDTIDKIIEQIKTVALRRY
ncbi:type I restriction endonuclease subunit R [Bacillus cereus]|uniref:type I restriction endonuclease subunit R n=1 Tax=Bacillus cereus TaxID=1396 RepID=UPI00119F8929|nr:type I restriction endonuclease subunit R [Bacillus cereus]MCU5052768.1 type I restriction endonuclease subunit R [Bacillus cereus]MCU5192188.1 type I restriction endonuclease subunit R [Bacillus cereus]MCU5637781.1 type I restriction endonuclease subunit R [Bacillus cereus]